MSALWGETTPGQRESLLPAVRDHSGQGAKGVVVMIALYLGAIIAANLLTAAFGPSVSIFNAFVLIGVDLTVRDSLHDRWHGPSLWPRMLALIGAGSIISAALNWQAAPIAVASFAAFLCANVADALIYQRLLHRPKLLRVNGSNVVSAAVDSMVFSALAFGFPLLWVVMVGQFAAKTIGGFVWSLVLHRVVLVRRGV